MTQVRKARSIPKTRRRLASWAVLRYVLGLLQMTSAVTGLILLTSTGVTPLTLAVVVLTGVLTTVSVILFGGRKKKNR